MEGANEEGFVVQPQEPQQQRARPPENHGQHPPPPPPVPSCPRCDSSNTKFCYYNNYSVTQPRYYCKSCRRYWTQGGTLRNVPVGGGFRRNKRPRIHGSPPSSASNGLNLRAQGVSDAAPQPAAIASRSAPPPMPLAPSGGSFYGGGSFMPSLASMQPSPGGIIHGQAAAMMGGGGGSRFGPNMGLLQGMAFPPMNAQAPSHLHSSPSSARFFQSQQGLIPLGRFSPWTQNVINAGGASTSSAAPPSGLWRNNGGAGSSEAGSSFTPNQWSDCNQGFTPSAP